MTIHCEIVTQERLVYSGDVDIVNLPGIEGRMGILPHHSPLLTVLDFGEVVVRRHGEEEYFAIGGGFAEIQPDKVIVLADSAEHAEEIDEERAAEARQRAMSQMEVKGDIDPDAYALIEQSLRWANLRLDISKRRQRSGSPRRRNIPDYSSDSE